VRVSVSLPSVEHSISRRFVQSFFGISKLVLKALNRMGQKGIYIRGPMEILSTDALGDLPFSTTATAGAAPSGTPSEIECEVMNLFEQFRGPLLRYVLSFGVSVHDAEEVTQEVFLSLFRHLQLRKSRDRLPDYPRTGWNGRHPEFMAAILCIIDVECTRQRRPGRTPPPVGLCR
jgi:hypothetical protein